MTPDRKSAGIGSLTPNQLLVLNVNGLNTKIVLIYSGIILSIIVRHEPYRVLCQGPVPERRNNSIPRINVPYFRDNFIPGINFVPERRNSAIQGINQG